MSSLNSVFAWIDHSEAERRRMLEAIEMFRDRGTRDELGLSTVRDGFADLLFPGTGSLQTRARYFMFVPWMYRLLEEQRVSSADVSRKARQFEVKLINALDESDEKSGIIGVRKRAALQRLPSSIYWSGLKRLGIRQFTGAQDEYHKSLDGWYRANRGAVRNDDGEVEGKPRPNWHDVPSMPPGFPERAELRMSEAEAEYLRRRVLTEAPASLFAFIVDRLYSGSDYQFVWDHPLSASFPPDLGRQVLHARNFAECSVRAQFLCLAAYLKDEAIARRAHQAWAALSRAAHFHPYELPPTREELLAWDEVVMDVIHATEAGWR